MNQLALKTKIMKKYLSGEDLSLALMAVISYTEELSATDYRGNPPVEHYIASQLCRIIEANLTESLEG